MKSFYTLLDVAPNSTTAEIRRAYLEFLRSNHPDKQRTSSHETVDLQQTNTADSDSDTLIQLAQKAWLTLSDSNSRRSYDNWLREQTLRSEGDWSSSICDSLSLSDIEQIISEEKCEGEEAEAESIPIDCRCGGDYLVDQQTLSRVVDQITLPCSSCSLRLQIYRKRLKKRLESDMFADSPTSSSPFRGSPKVSRSAELDQGRVKILVLGEAGVGKSSFVQAAKGKAVRNPSWTVGCSVDVFAHSFKAGTPQESVYAVELWDVGGSRSHRSARRVFYQSAHGVILVHDRTNRKSEHNLRLWLNELMTDGRETPANATTLQQSSSQSRLPTSVFDTAERYFGDGKALPILVIGTKSDLLPQADVTNGGSATKQKGRFAVEYGTEEIWMDCREPMSPGSTNFVKLSRFFDRVIEVEYYASSVAPRKRSALYQTTNTALLTERRRKLY